MFRKKKPTISQLKFFFSLFLLWNPYKWQETLQQRLIRFCSLGKSRQKMSGLNTTLAFCPGEPAETGVSFGTEDDM